MTETALKLDGVTRTFGKTAAVSGISLDVKRGEIVSLVGHSGCGKSTLLRVIAGIDVLDAGQVFINGGEVSGPNGFVEPENRNVGFVFQDYALFPHLTARENILFGLKKQPRAQALERANEVIRHIGIEHLADRHPHTLSGGEQQRVALARALAPKPDILLMDEPFSNLDQGLREKVRTDTLALLKSLGTTVIMVTHDPQEALSCGDRVVLMRAGHIVQAGSAYDLYDRPANTYAAEFFCAFNKIPGIYRDGSVETILGTFPHQVDVAAGTPTILYVRPQSVLVSETEGTIEGKIIARVFQGEAELLFLKIKGLESPVRARTTKRVVSGIDRLKLKIRSEDTLVFSE